MALPRPFFACRWRGSADLLLRSPARLELIRFLGCGGFGNSWKPTEVESAFLKSEPLRIVTVRLSLKSLAYNRPLLGPATFVHSVDKIWSFLLSIKDAHDLAVAINDLQAADDYGSVHTDVSLKRKRLNCMLRVTLSAKPSF